MSNLNTEQECLSNNVNNVWTACCQWSPIEPGIDLIDQDLDAGVVDASTVVTTAADIAGSDVVITLPKNLPGAASLAAGCQLRGPSEGHSHRL
mgnify:CR=1 FL=1